VVTIQVASNKMVETQVEAATSRISSKKDRPLPVAVSSKMVATQVGNNSKMGRASSKIVMGRVTKNRMAATQVGNSSKMATSNNKTGRASNSKMVIHQEVLSKASISARYSAPAETRSTGPLKK